ncbi:ABC transporter ATP-binding protein [Brytella acorum]|uniref:ATP-binding cassette domain-containing protein n=1 Tax=Brytella acorum TaxID=2959299 RepID=A0AA35UZE2_9PROT|nr:ATP-binding cassette domain-containing protein [Brytella acorum]CAI9122295.1 ATP-binding cassette domain-containing protein [Brytella acorum]
MSAHSRHLPAIAVESLVKRYGAETVVDGLNVSIAPGETFAFLGPNGAGKTTTIKMLTTLLPPDEGRILLNGVDLAKDPMNARRHFGVVFQDCTLDKTMTVHENLWMHCALHRIPRAQRRLRIGDVLALFDLADRRDSMVSALSGGLRRRVEIARALLHHPALIFLDEPTLGLDPKSRRILWAHLQHLQKECGTTIFLTSHYLDEVERFAHNVAVIQKGRIIMQGTVDSIIRYAEKTTLEDSFLFLTSEETQTKEDRAVVAGA